ncbi:MAG: hypothetical protein QOE75_775 [Solirubrobacterales bacterium]|jgi:predicted transcriptional regulator|nr:hypothetical protein [Solirubrobacterales bacterium]
MPHKATSRTTQDEDDKAEVAVLAVVLSEHPALMTLAEIAGEVDDADAADRGVHRLVGVGLLRREGESVIPTRAALRFSRLVQW